MLPGLLNNPMDDRDLGFWSFNNMAEHRNIVTAIYTRKNIALNVYVIDPMPQKDISSWLWKHQAMHNDMDQVLNIPSNDLTSVDFTKPDQVATWLLLHYQEHMQARSILNLTG